MNNDIAHRVADVLRGTCRTIDSVLEELEIEDNIDEEDLSDCECEQCPICEWWMEPCELVDDDGEVVGCEQCRDSSEEE